MKLAGNAPRVIAHVDLKCTEMMAWLYCPIKLPGQVREKYPANLRQFAPLVEAVFCDVFDTYDAAEQRYLTLCRELGRENTIVHKGYPGFEDVPGSGMMEVDESRPSVQRVIYKLGLNEQTRRTPRK